MRAIVLTLAALVFGALLLFDTTALIQLSWLCLTGHCGVPARWVALGVGAIVAACVLLAWLSRRRRRGKPRGAKPAAVKPRAGRRKQAKR